MIPLILGGIAGILGAGALHSNRARSKNLIAQQEEHQRTLQAQLEEAKRRRDTETASAIRQMQAEIKRQTGQLKKADAAMLEQYKKDRKQRQGFFDTFRADYNAPVDTDIFNIRTETDEKGNVIRKSKLFTPAFQAQMASLGKVGALGATGAQNLLKQLEEPYSIKGANDEDYDPLDFSDTADAIRKMFEVAKSTEMDTMVTGRLAPRLKALDQKMEREVQAITENFQSRGMSTVGNPAYMQAIADARQEFTMRKLVLEEGVRSNVLKFFTGKQRLLGEAVRQDVLAKVSSIQQGNLLLDRKIKAAGTLAGIASQSFRTISDISQGGPAIRKPVPLQRVDPGLAQAKSVIAARKNQALNRVSNYLQQLQTMNIGNLNTETQSLQRMTHMSQQNLYNQRHGAINKEFSSMMNIGSLLISDLMKSNAGDDKGNTEGVGVFNTLSKWLTPQNSGLASGSR